MSDFRARSSAEILDAAVEIYRRHFAIFFTAGVVYALPMALVQYSAFSITQVASRAAGVGALPAESFALMQGTVVLAWLAMLVTTPFTDGVSIAAAERSYRGQSVDFADAVRAVFSRPLAVFLAYWARFFIVFGLFFAAALVLGIVAAVLRTAALLVVFPAIIALGIFSLVVWKRYFAVMPALLAEGKGVADAMHRSRTLADGHGARIILLVGGVFLGTFIFAALLSGFATALVSGIVGTLLYLLCVALVNQFTAIVVTLLYFDLRIRKEGYDIELLTSALGPSSGPDMNAAAASA
jgi:hypothetical protein